MSGRIPHGEDSEEEDEFFVPDGSESSVVSSRLGSLFSSTGKAGGNSSLTYKAPKQPVAKDENASDQQSKTNVEGEGKSVRVFHATTAHCFVLKDGSYVSQGKIGVALLGNRMKKDCKILLYQSNKQPVGQATISDALLVTVDAHKYVHFVDDRSLSWSLAFLNENQMLEFLKWYLLVKALWLGEKCKEFLTLDIEEGAGDPVAVGDSVEVEYVEYLIEDGPAITLANEGSQPSKEPLRVRLGKDASKPWVDGLSGMKKRGRRLVLILAAAGCDGDSKGSFSTGMALVTLKRVKVPKKQAATEAVEAIRENKSMDGNLPVSSESANEVVSGSNEEPVKECARIDYSPQKSASDSNVHKKADLVNRMARIGQAVLGAVPPAAQSGQDSENRIHSIPASGKPVAPPRVAPSQHPSTGNASKPVVPDTRADASKPSPESALVRDGHPGASATAAGVVTPHAFLQPHVFDSSAMPIPFPPLSSSGSAMPYIYPIAYPAHLLPPPFMPPASTGGLAPAEAPDQRNVMDEIRRCHLQLQDALAKTVSSNFGNILKDFTDVVEAKFAQLPTFQNQVPGDSSLRDNFSDMISKMDHIDELVRNITTHQDESIVKQMNELGENMARMNELVGSGAALPGPQTDGPSSPTADKVGQLKELTEKMTALHATIETLRDDLMAEREWKEKHDKVKSQALAMKEKYESRVWELEQQCGQGETEKPVGVTEQEKIKKIMNAFYKSVNKRLPKEGNLTADVVRGIIIAAVKESTFDVLNEPTDQTMPMGSSDTLRSMDEPVSSADADAVVALAGRASEADVTVTSS